MLDDIFSKDTNLLPRCTDGWKLWIRNHPNKVSNIPLKSINKALPESQSEVYLIPERFLRYFQEEYQSRVNIEEMRRHYEPIRKLFETVPILEFEAAIVTGLGKELIDYKFSTYPYMVDEQLYAFWKSFTNFKLPFFG